MIPYSNFLPLTWFVQEDYCEQCKARLRKILRGISFASEFRVPRQHKKTWCIIFMFMFALRLAFPHPSREFDSCTHSTWRATHVYFGTLKYTLILSLCNFVFQVRLRLVTCFQCLVLCVLGVHLMSFINRSAVSIWKNSPNVYDHSLFL